MKNLSFLPVGVLTTFLAVATTGCSDNTDRANPGTPNATDSRLTQSSSAQSSWPEAGTGGGKGNDSGEASSEYKMDPTGSGPGE